MSLTLLAIGNSSDWLTRTMGVFEIFKSRIRHFQSLCLPGVLAWVLPPWGLAQEISLLHTHRLW